MKKKTKTLGYYLDNFRMCIILGVLVSTMYSCSTYTYNNSFRIPQKNGSININTSLNRNSITNTIHLRYRYFNNTINFTIPNNKR